MRPSRRRDAPRSGEIRDSRVDDRGSCAAPATAAGLGSLETRFECGPDLAVLRRESPRPSEGLAAGDAD
eukprot:6699184-Alexandrium_andersonii.AAC.1